MLLAGLLRGLLGLQLRELLSRLHVADLVAQRGEPRVERRCRPAPPEVRLGDRVLMCSRTLSSALTSASTERPSSCSWMRMRACADCILASIESRSALSLRISLCTPMSDSFALVGVLLRRVELRLHLGHVGGELVLLLDEHDGEIVLVRFERGAELGLGLREVLGLAFLTRSSTSSRRRMMAAVALFSREYFSTIELMAFSYAISGMLPSRRPKSTATGSRATDCRDGRTRPHVDASFSSRTAGAAAPARRPPGRPADRAGFGDSRTTRATASCPKNSRTCCTPSFFSLQARATACCSCTRPVMTVRMRATSSSNCRFATPIRARAPVCPTAPTRM